MPLLREHDVLPGDLEEFYEVCAGMRLLRSSSYSMEIVGPAQLTRANPEIVGEECPEDISDSWYIVARGGGQEAISIDCHFDRCGRCYDSFWDRHAIRGECAIVATSFTELLERLISGKGGYWYWLDDHSSKYADAYD